MEQFGDVIVYIIAVNLGSCICLCSGVTCNFIHQTRMHSSRIRTTRLRIIPGGGGGEGVVTWSRGGGGVVRRMLHTSPRWTEWVTHACENITFARYATRAVTRTAFQWGAYRPLANWHFSCTPPAMHDPPAMHTPLPCTQPCHTHHPMHAPTPPFMDGMTRQV